MDGQSNRVVDTVSPMLMQMMMQRMQQQQQRNPGAGSIAPQAPMRPPMPPMTQGAPGLLNQSPGGIDPNLLRVMMMRGGGASSQPGQPGQTIPENIAKAGQGFAGALPMPNFGSQYQLPPEFTWMPMSGGGV